MNRLVWTMPAILLAALAVGAVAPASAEETGTQATQQVQSLDPTAAATFASNSLVQTGPMTDSMPGAPARPLVIQAHAQTLRPAPLPNEDFDEPGPGPQALAAQDQASVGPSFYGAAKPFAGDGYAPGSTLDDRVSHRHTGGGMSLSIPMQ